MPILRNRSSRVYSEKLLHILRVHAELVSANHSLDESLFQLVVGACQLAQVPRERSQIRVVNPESKAIQQDVQADGTNSRLSDVVTVTQGVTGRAMRQCRVQNVADVGRDPDYVVAYKGVQSELAIPLLQGDLCWGVMNFESAEKKHFTPELIPLLEALAQQAVLTIQYDALRRQHLSEQAAQDKLVREQLEQLASATLSALPGAEATVEVQLLLNNDEDLITAASKTDSLQPAIPGSFGKGSTLAWQAVLEDAAVRRSDLSLNDLSTSLPTTFAALIMPLHGRDGNVRGVLNIEAPRNSRLNDDQELATAEIHLQPYREQGEAILRRADDATLQQVTSFDTVLAEMEDAIEKLDASSDLDEFYGLVARSIGQMLGGSSVQVAILLIERDRQTEQNWLVLSPIRTYQYRDVLSRGVSWPDSIGFTGRVARTGHHVLERDVRSGDVVHEYHDILSSAVSELDVPIVREDPSGGRRVIGVININSPEYGIFTEDHLRKVDLLAKRIARAIERVQQLQDGLVAEQHLKLIGDTNNGIEQMLGEARDQGLEALTPIRARRTSILEALLDSALRYSGASFGTVLLAIDVPFGPSRRHDRTGAEVSREFISLATRPTKELEIPLERGIAQQLYDEFDSRLVAEPRIIIENMERCAPESRPVTITPNAKSAVALPINNGTGVIGVLCLEATIDLTYSPEQLEWLKLLASQMANVISTANLHLYRLQQRTLIKLEQDLVKASGGISREPLDPEMQQRVLTTALQLTEQEDGHAEIWFTQGTNVQLSSYLQDGQFWHDKEHTKELNEAGIVRRAYDTRRPMLVLDITWDEWAAIYKENWELTRSELAVPLLDSSAIDPQTGLGRVIGILNLESRLPMGFGHRDVDILELLAQSVVTAIKNRELYRTKMDLLRDVTHALQKALYPLRPAVFNLKDLANDSVTANETLGKQLSTIEEIANLSDMASNLLRWFQQLIISEQRPEDVVKEPTSVSKLVRTLTARMQPWARREHKQLVFDSPPDEVMLDCAPGLIQGALFLLIDNALRYSPPGDSVSVRLLPPSAGTALIEVIDHGEHLDAEEARDVFARGKRGRSRQPASAGEIEGGIGLDHVRRIVSDLHMGEVGYLPRPGENVFYIRLPLQIPASTDSEM